MAERLSPFAAQQGYALARVFTDVRGHTDSGLYRMLAALRRGQAVAVLVPDLDHLRQAGCLTGADMHAATRYLRARVLPLIPAPDRGALAPAALRPAPRPTRGAEPAAQRSGQEEHP